MDEIQKIPEDKLVIPIPDILVEWFTIQNKKQGLVSAILGIEESKISYEQAASQRELFIKDFGIGDYEDLLRRILWQSKAKVSFSDFREFRGVRNNFHCYFGESGNWFFDLYKTKEYYQNFSKKYPELNEQIISIYRRKIMAFYIESPRELALLYKAYELMFEDPSVSINHNLFS